MNCSLFILCYDRIYCFKREVIFLDITQTVEILLISVFAGVVGSLLGLGGGIIVTPALTLIFGIDIQYAIGASIISVIATSSGSAIAYIKDGITNLRVGMFLEIATTIGAITGAFVSGLLGHGTLHHLRTFTSLFCFQHD